MNSDYKRPESVLIIIYTEAGDTVLLRRLPAPAGVWQSVTGSLRWGETADAAAQRELLEETGICARPLATGIVNRFEIVAAARHLYAPGVSENTESVYELCLPQRCPIQTDPAEHGEYDWCPLAEAVERVWSWSNRQALQAVLARSLNPHNTWVVAQFEKGKPDDA